MLKVGFKKNGRFKDFFIKVCCLEKELQDFYKDCFEIEFKEKDLLNKENFVNHKLCANEMIEVFLFCIEIQRYCNKDYIYKNNVEYIYNRLDEILEKIVRTLKYFYELI